MPIPTELEVIHTIDRFGKPLIKVESMMGSGLEAYPNQLRALAAALCKAADDAESLDRMHRERFPTSKAQYPLDL